MYRENSGRTSRPSSSSFGSRSSNSFGNSSNRRSGGFSSGRPSSGGRSFGGGGRSFGGSRFGGNRRSGGGRGFRGAFIAHEKYIYKAEEVLESSKYEPKNKFSDFDILEGLKKNIERKGYVYPTKIQDLTIPSILEGKDVIGLASTGSGKTAAFLIPMINKVFKDRAQRILIIVPTRELATQIETEFKDFSRGSGMGAVIVIGGASMSRQIFDLRKNPQFIIGTPGRLKDLLERGALDLKKFNNVILDEVDRMLDMGFIDDIKHLISHLDNEKQSLFFSATMSREASLIATTLLKNPVRVESETQSTSKNVDQDIVKVTSKDSKVEVLHNLLIKEDFTKVLIFSKTKRGADRLTDELLDRGFKVDSIHGDKPQAKRDRVIIKFKTDAIKILVATDVAARGIDIPDISHVINYDEPATYEDYIHRIGRTGRYNKKGKALTFVN